MGVEKWLLPPLCWLSFKGSRATDLYLLEVISRMEAKIEVFLSYAHEDEQLKQELLKHLTGLQNNGLILLWHDRQISAGTEWVQAIHAHLNTSHIVLLLISPDFMASGYCIGVEMQYALQRHQRGEARVVPLILRPTYWQIDPLDKLQALPKEAEPVTLWANQDAAFLDIVQGILSIISELRGEMPIVGPAIHATKVPSIAHAIYLMKMIEERKIKNAMVVELVQTSTGLIQKVLKIGDREQEESGWKEMVDEGTKITVWLEAEGNVSYVIDSITISHQSSHLQAAGPKSGATPPDAEYIFQIIRDSTQTYALNPALVLSHEDRREVSFTLTLLSPEEGLSPFDSVESVLHYHAFDGTQGRLYLRAPPKAGLLLSRILKMDVEAEGFITTPKGLQRGKSENGENRETLVYEPLLFPFHDWPHADRRLQDLLHSNSLEKDALDLTSHITLTPERLALNRVIEEKDMLPHILDLLQVGDRLAFDLCAGMLSPECEKALFQIGISGQRTDSELPGELVNIKWELNYGKLKISNKIASSATYALSIRHMLEPSDSLADFILALPSSKSSLSDTAPIAFLALLLHRRGKWVQALTMLTAFSLRESFGSVPHALGLFLSLRENLTSDERSIADEFAEEQFEQFLKKDTVDHQLDLEPLLTVVKYLLQTGSPSIEIEQKLLAMKRAIPKTSFNIYVGLAQKLRKFARHVGLIRKSSIQNWYSERTSGNSGKAYAQSNKRVLERLIETCKSEARETERWHSPGLGGRHLRTIFSFFLHHLRRSEKDM